MFKHLKVSYETTKCASIQGSTDCNSRVLRPPSIVSGATRTHGAY